MLIIISMMIFSGVFSLLSLTMKGKSCNDENEFALITYSV
jgi:hypothetical protein